jgi:hypothetical protein
MPPTGTRALAERYVYESQAVPAITTTDWNRTEGTGNSMAYDNDSTTEHRPVVSTTEARQGVTGHNVRYVLGFGLAGIIIAFGGIYFMYFG